MGFLHTVAFGTIWGPFPVVVWIGLATYVLLLLTAAVAMLKRRIKALRRVPMAVHRGLAVAAIVLATFHLVLGLSAYV